MAQRREDAAVDRRDFAWWTDKAVSVLVFIGGISAILFIIGIFVFITREGFGFGEHFKAGEFFGSTRWAPTSESNPTYGILALIVGTASVTGLAMLIAVPFSLGAAIYIAEFAQGRTREILKVLVEMLAAIPSVVWGFIGLTIMNPLIIQTFDVPIGLCVLNSGLILGLMAAPIMTTIAEDALKAVPDSYREAAEGPRATRWQVTRRVVLPAARQGCWRRCCWAWAAASARRWPCSWPAATSINLPTSPFDSVQALTPSPSWARRPVGSPLPGALHPGHPAVRGHLPHQPWRPTSSSAASGRRDACFGRPKNLDDARRQALPHPLPADDRPAGPARAPHPRGAGGQGWIGPSWDFLFTGPTDGMTAGGLLPALVGTVWLVVIALIDIGAHRHRRSPLPERVRPRQLADPRHQPGHHQPGRCALHRAALFGVGAFVMFFGFGTSILAASFTLAVMTLPVVIVSTREALQARAPVVPRGLLEHGGDAVADHPAVGAAQLRSAASDRRQSWRSRGPRARRRPSCSRARRSSCPSCRVGL
ncbi:MAG: ABC transporter permease subunit [bacterium]